MADKAPGLVDRVTGSAGAIVATLTNLSYRETDGGRRYAYPDFGADLIHLLYAELPRPSRRGLFRARIECPNCGTSLEEVPVTTVEVVAELPFTRIPPVGFEAEVPGLQCPNCRSGLMLKDRDVESELSDALRDAFERAGIRPG